MTPSGPPDKASRSTIIRRVALLSAMATFFYFFKILAVIYLFFLLVITIHELGHFAAGRLCGYRLISLRVGPAQARRVNILNLQLSKPDKWSWHFQDSTWNWLSGETRMLPTSYPIPNPIGRHLIFILGGVAANLVTALLVLPVARLDTAIGAAGKLFITLSCLSIFANLLTPGGPGHTTDGLWLVRLLFNKNRRESELFLLTIFGRLSRIRRHASKRDMASASEELLDMIQTVERLIAIATDPTQRERLVAMRDLLRKSFPSLAAINA